MSFKIGFYVEEILAPALHDIVVAIAANETSAKLEWNHSRVCFEDCDVTFNLTWTSSHQGQSRSVETNDTMFCITSLKHNEDYEATLTALCRKQSQVSTVSKTVGVTFNTFSGEICMYRYSTSMRHVFYYYVYL